MAAARLAWSAFGLTTAIAVMAAVVGFVDDGTRPPAPDTGRETVQPAHVSLWMRAEAGR